MISLLKGVIRNCCNFYIKFPTYCAALQSDRETNMKDHYTDLYKILIEGGREREQLQQQQRSSEEEKCWKTIKNDTKTNERETDYRPEVLFK